jgi:hypothetical protein
MLTVAEKRINNWLAYNRVIHQPENQDLVQLLEGLKRRQSNTNSINRITSQLKVLADKELQNSIPYKIPEAHRQIYKTVGGAAHLDQNYTVFGEVIKGMDVVDSIAGVKTDSLDRPVDDVRIISAKLIKRKAYK